jgi:hypothetical protein
MSSFLICKISAGVRPDIIRRIDIMAASLQQRSSGLCVFYSKGMVAVYPSATPLWHTGSVEMWNIFPSPEDRWGCIQKFPDWVDNEIYAYNNKHSLRNNIKGYGSKTHKMDSQNCATTAPFGRELYHLQFLLQVASLETFGYTFVHYKCSEEN